MSDAPARRSFSYGAEPPAARGAGRVRTPGRWPLGFVALSLLALVVAPALLGYRIASIEEEISEVLDPARDLSAELALLHSRQMSRFQGYLLTGESLYRDRYRALRDQEIAVSAALRERVRGTDLRIRQQVAFLQMAATEWQMHHGFALQGEAERLQYLESIPDDQRRYDAVLSGARDLTSALNGEIQGARGRMDRARDFQVFITIALAALALLATAAVAGIGRRLRALVAEAERRRGEALTARREMEAVLEATGDGVLGIDLEGRCQTLNQTGSRLLGYAEVEARGRHVHDLLHGRSPGEEGHDAEACPAVEALRAGTGGRDMEDVFWRRDGTAFPARWQLRPLRDGRVVRGAVLTLTDMTEIRKAEDALRQAVEARDQVVAVVSHDLRNPLGTISAAADLLVELELPEEKRDEQLRIIRRAAGRMNRLIEALLDVSRIEGGELPMELASLQLAQLVRDALELHAPLAREKGIALAWEGPENLPPVLGDPDRILQVFFNLLGNAFKHTPPGGRVTVDARVAGEPGEQQVVVSVTDTGEGIERADLERLFDRFWQARSSGRSGAGLGLTIVKGIVEAHGGRVWVDSEPGKGSVFHFTLLLQPEGVRSGPAAQPGAAPAWGAAPDARPRAGA